MTNMQLLDAIGMLSEDIIADADAPAEKRAKVLPWRQIGTVAACLCIAVGVFLVPLTGRRMHANDDSIDVITQAGTSVVIEPISPDASFAPDTTVAMPESIYPTEEWATTTTQVYTTTAVTNLTTTRAWEDESPATTTVHGTYESAPAESVIIPEEGILIYEQNFDNLPDTEDQAAMMVQLGLSKDSAFSAPGTNAYSESDVRFAIEGGRLYIDNHDETPVEGRGQDAYFRIAALNDEIMRPVVAGKYTLEYELEYVTADANAYVALITEYSQDCYYYNLFALRPDGTGLHACHFYDNWKHFTEDNTDIPANKLTEKLTGIRTDTEQPLAHVRMTVRLQWNPEYGHTVYLKTAGMADFVMISEPSAESTGSVYIGWDRWDGRAVALKVSGAVDAYIDNIRILTGWIETTA